MPTHGNFEEFETYPHIRAFDFLFPSSEESFNQSNNQYYHGLLGGLKLFKRIASSS